MCCEDGLHCCPTGTTCDAAAGMCRSTVNSLATSWNFLLRRSAVMSRFVAEERTPNTQCPDHSSCFDDSTCCELPDGHYGCCDYEKVCQCCQFLFYHAMEFFKICRINCCFFFQNLKEELLWDVARMYCFALYKH